jgi:hypothetical protein
MNPDVSPIIVTSLSKQAIRATGLCCVPGARVPARGHNLALAVAGRQPRSAHLPPDRDDKKLTEFLISELVNSLVTDVPAEVGASEDVYASFPEIQPFIQVDRQRALAFSAFSDDLSTRQKGRTGGGCR